jgi:uncharacterized protein (DUF2147 family)
VNTPVSTFTVRTARLRTLRHGLLACAIVACGPVAGAAQDATGIWRTEATEQGYLEVRVAPCVATALCGTILRARDLQGQEQPYEHRGKKMIRDMVATGPATWSNGRIWDPRNNRTFRSRMELAGNRLLVSGCVLGVCQSQTWHRQQ